MSTDLSYIVFILYWGKYNNASDLLKIQTIITWTGVWKDIEPLAKFILYCASFICTCMSFTLLL